MEVRIGLVDNGKELAIEVENKTADDLTKAVEAAVEGDTSALWLTDKDGRRVCVAAAKVAYVEFTIDDESHRVGFGKA